MVEAWAKEAQVTFRWAAAEVMVAEWVAEALEVF